MFRLTLRASVLHTGNVMWAPAFKWRTSCQVNLRYFPYDAQICEVQFVNWMYGSFEVNLTHLENFVYTDYFISNPAWELVSTCVGRKDDMFANLTLPKVAFQLKLTRKPKYYMLNVVVPSLITTMMTLMVFCLPAASGEKVSVPC